MVPSLGVVEDALASVDTVTVVALSTGDVEDTVVSVEVVRAVVLSGDIVEDVASEIVSTEASRTMPVFQLLAHETCSAVA